MSSRSTYGDWDRKHLVTGENIQKGELSSQESAAPQSGSNWNHAGTFEEKHWDKWAADRIKELWKSIESADKSLKVTAVTDVTAEASAIFTRGKKKTGYEVDGKLKVGQHGTITVHAESGEDALVQCSSKSLETLKGAVEASLQRFEAELQAK
jgi:hypothetical protein